MKHLANDKPIVMKNMKKNQVGLFPSEWLPVKLDAVGEVIFSDVNSIALYVEYASFALLTDETPSL